MDERFEQLRRTWDQLGASDPLWAVLSDPQKRGNRWDTESFLASGRQEVDGLLRTIGERFPDVPRGCALDFGCGVGRLSRALAAHFGRVIGVDVAASMIRRARDLNADLPGCEFVLNERTDLSVVASGSVDLVYSNIVLQHIAPAYSELYVREFVRVLSPQGLAVFQIPYRLRGAGAALLSGVVPGPVLATYRRFRYGRQRIDMHALPVARVQALVRESGGAVVGEEESDAAAPKYRSRLYFVRRAARA